LPVVSSSAFISGVVDYALPRYDLTGTNKYIFVERFNAPGGPDVSSRGSMDINAEEYSVYNELNQRNSIVRNALQSWQTEHCGQFGINPTGSPGDGTNPSQHMTNPLSYDGVVAAYHKVNRNPTQTCLVKYGYDRQVNWLGLNGEITFDRTTSIISKPAGASTGWNAGAVGNEKLPRNGYLSFEVTTISDDQLVGLNSNPPAGASYGDMDYSIQVSVTGPGNVYVWQNGTAVVNPASFQTAVGEIFKIAREGTTIYYQRSVDGGKNFVTFYTSGTPSTTDLYPDITLYDAGAGVRNVKISNPQYDNWYVQHAIPQSELQYAWINDSYDNKKDQPFGYASNYSVPSGTTSTTASAVQFSTASNWNFPTFGSPSALEPLKVNYAQMWPGPRANWGFSPSEFKYQLVDTTLDFVGFYATTSSNNGRNIIWPADAGFGWSGSVASRNPLLDSTFLEFEIGPINSGVRYVVGLNDDPPAQGAEEGYSELFSDMEYVIVISPAWRQIYVNGTLKDTTYETIEENNKFRIVRNGNTISFDKSTNIDAPFTQIYKSTTPVSGTLYPDFAFYKGASNKTIELKNISLHSPNLLMPGYGFISGSKESLDLPPAINIHFNNLNGPYQHPSWKQTRGGETPVARYQRRNNILSVMSPITPTIIANGAGTGVPALNYGERRGDSFKNFIEPPVDFKYKPLDI